MCRLGVVSGTGVSTGALLLSGAKVAEADGEDQT
jgi:hypothetical protein